jgi:hypothetical protein
VYEDGSGFCFSCNYYHRSRGSSVSSLRQRLNHTVTSTPHTRELTLPQDTSGHIPEEPLTWLRSYGLTTDEIRKHHLCFSSERQMLIFPYFNYEGTLIFYQGRYFPKREPKAYTPTYKTTPIRVPGGSSNRIVFVEDPVSAIKVSRVMDACPLFGSHLDLHTVLSFRKFHAGGVLWLDSDKTRSSLKFIEQYSYMFKEGLHVVRSERDPKEYSTDQIKGFLK